MLKLVETPQEMEEEMLPTLDEIAREGARRMLLSALEEEVTSYLDAHHDERDEKGHALVVRNGKARPRSVTVGSQGCGSCRACRSRGRADASLGKLASRTWPPSHSSPTGPWKSLRGLRDSHSRLENAPSPRNVAPGIPLRDARPEVSRNHRVERFPQLPQPRRLR